jgi:hypothetical protein
VEGRKNFFELVGIEQVIIDERPTEISFQTREYGNEQVTGSICLSLISQKVNRRDIEQITTGDYDSLYFLIYYNQ